MTILRKATLATALAACAGVASVPAEARDRYYRHHRGGDNDAALAIGAGIVGLAIGAAIASDRNDRYYDDRYYDDRGYYQPRYRGGYYYQGYPAYRAYPRYKVKHKYRYRDGYRGRYDYRYGY